MQIVLMKTECSVKLKRDVFTITNNFYTILKAILCKLTLDFFRRIDKAIIIAYINLKVLVTAGQEFHDYTV